MTYWEFLLQQDGDRTWLPLETAHVEILEGRYRIVAHTSHSDTPVDIHLTQLLAEQMPPKRRVLKRQGRTNDDGLMVVLPFTHLTAGTWTLRCCAADPSGDNSDPLDYGVQLRVVPVEDDPDNWLPDWDMPEDEPLPASLQALTNPLAESLVGQQVTPSSVPGATATAPPAPAQTTVGLPQVSDDFPEIEAQPLGALPLRLRLDQQALMAQPQQPITLAGEVIAMGEASVLPGAGSLGLQLRDPDRGKVVARLSRSLSWTTLPTAFEMTIPVPDVSGTRLLVGEMSLWLGTVDAPQVMAIQGFTVTTNLNSLLEAVTQRGEAGLTFQEDTLETGIEDPAGTPRSAPSAEAKKLEQETVKTAPLAMPAVREVPFRLIYLPASGLTLPPQIQSVAPSDRLPRSLALPTLPNQPVRSAPKAPQDPQKALELPLIAPRGRGAENQSQMGAPAALDANQGADAEPERALELPPLGKPASGQTPQAQEPSSLDTPLDTRQDPEVMGESISQVPSLVPDAEFTALNLKDRFWGRLTALAQDGHSAAAGLKREMEAAGVEADIEQEGAPSLDLPTVEPIPTVAVTAPSHEVVIYDEPEPSLDESTDGLGTAGPNPDAATSDDLETLVVPVPQIELSETTLVAGKPLSLTVSLPPFPHRLAVKFWMTDIQNRSLLEKPRWLMNWTPSGAGQLEALLQLQVPMGCLEVRFEAIAVDLATQEESHKITLQRPITPSQGAITAPEDFP